MLGLPSTTAVGRRMPKELFYRNLTLPSDVKRSFVEDVERIELAHSVRSSTTGIPDGVAVHEVLVIEVALKERKVPESVLSCIARTNQHRLLFVCTYGEKVCLCHAQGARREPVATCGWLDARGECGEHGPRVGLDCLPGCLWGCG